MKIARKFTVTISLVLTNKFHTIAEEDVLLYATVFLKTLYPKDFSDINVARECETNCGSEMFTCLENCGSNTECSSACYRENVVCVDACPCHAGKMHRAS